MPRDAMTGRCLCGAVTYEATGVDTKIHACHCGMCRRWSGGPGLGAIVGALRFDDDAHVGVYGSSDWAERGFCRACGTNLFYRLREGGQTVVWLGTFDDPSPFALAGEIFVDEKPDAYAFAGDHPRQTGAEFLASVGLGGDD